MKRTHVTASFLAVLIAIALVPGVPIFGDDTINITTPAI